MPAPRDPVTGRFACVPSYPRKYASPCGCSGGGSRPCPVAKKLAPARAAGKRAYVRSRGAITSELEEIEEQLMGLEYERAAMADAKEVVRQQIRNAGVRVGRKLTSSKGQRLNDRGGTVSVIDQYGQDSEEGERELQQKWRNLINHEKHQQAEYRDLTAEHKKLSLLLQGAARVKNLFQREPKSPQARLDEQWEREHSGKRLYAQRKRTGDRTARRRGIR